MSSSSRPGASLLSSPRKRASVLYDEYGFAVQKQAVEKYQIYCQNNAENELARMVKFEDCLFDTPDGFKDRMYSQMVRTGIPRGRRRMEWLECSGLQFEIERSANYYAQMVEAAHGDVDQCELVSHKCRDVIEKDIVRIGENCVIDRDKMVVALRNVLLAYCVDAEGDGYQQGMNFIVSAVLMLDFTEEEAFWLLKHVCTQLFPLNFTPTMIGVRADCEVLKYYMNVKCRDFMAIIEHFELPVDYFVSRFVMSLGFGILPQESCYRVWDRMITGGALEFFKCIIKIFNAVARTIQSRYGAKLWNQKHDWVIEIIDAELRALVDITDVLIRRIDGKPIEQFSFNKRRHKLRRTSRQRPRGLLYSERRDSASDINKLRERAEVEARKNGRREPMNPIDAPESGPGHSAADMSETATETPRRANGAPELRIDSTSEDDRPPATDPPPRPTANGSSSPPAALFSNCSSGARAELSTATGSSDGEGEVL